MSTRLHAFDMAGAGDVSALAAWLREQPLARLARLAVFAKTEGHHAPNDFSRELLKSSLAQLFAELGIDASRAVSMLAIGCEGVGVPQGYAFARFDDGGDAAGPARLALGCARSDPVPIEEIGTPALIDRVAATARAALADAGLDAESARLLFIKAPTLAARHTQATAARTSMHRGRAIAALGGGVALGEIDRERIAPASIASDAALFAHRVQAVTGAEIDAVEVVALGNRAGAGGELVADTTHMRDLLDHAAVRRLLARHGIATAPDGELAGGERVVALLAKVMVEEPGTLRGARTTVHTSAWAPEAQMRAAASGVFGSLLGHLRFFVTADAVHQAPAGGSTVTVILRT
jgi:ring-opening amidohydrolase-like protein